MFKQLVARLQTLMTPPFPADLEAVVFETARAFENILFILDAVFGVLESRQYDMPLLIRSIMGFCMEWLKRYEPEAADELLLTVIKVPPPRNLSDN